MLKDQDINTGSYSNFIKLNRNQTKTRSRSSLKIAWSLLGANSMAAIFTAVRSKKDCKEEYWNGIDKDFLLIKKANGLLGD